MAQESTNSTTFRNVLIGAVILLLLALGFMGNKNAQQKIDLNIADQNQKALIDSVRVSKNKAGQIEYSKNILVAEKEDLEKLNKDLYGEYMKEHGKVSELTSTIITIKGKPSDTIKLPSQLIKYENGDKGLAWEYDTIFDAKNYRKIKGVSNFKIDFSQMTYTLTPLTTNITTFDIGFNVVQGLRETKAGDVEMFVRSDHPGFEVKDLSAVIINPKTHPVLEKFANTSANAANSKSKRFGIGVNAGYGIYIDNTNKTAGVGIIAGVGVSYSLIKF